MSNLNVVGRSNLGVVDTSNLNVEIHIFRPH